MHPVVFSSFFCRAQYYVLRDLGITAWTVAMKPEVISFITCRRVTYEKVFKRVVSCRTCACHGLGPVSRPIAMSWESVHTYSHSNRRVVGASERARTPHASKNLLIWICAKLSCGRAFFRPSKLSQSAYAYEFLCWFFIAITVYCFFTWWECALSVNWLGTVRLPYSLRVNSLRCTRSFHVLLSSSSCRLISSLRWWCIAF